VELLEILIANTVVNIVLSFIESGSLIVLSGCSHTSKIGNILHLCTLGVLF